MSFIVSPPLGSGNVGSGPQKNKLEVLPVVHVMIRVYILLLQYALRSLTLVENIRLAAS
jgi:hypothetical protein